MTVRNPYVFIVGCPRSGTTLLRRMLDAHPQLAITPETHWVPEWPRKQQRSEPAGEISWGSVQRLMETARFRKLKIPEPEVRELFEDRGSVSYADLVAHVYTLFGRRRGKRLVGDKTPGYTRAISTLHDLLPWARFIHLIRDGRDVCLSANTWHQAERLKSKFPTWEGHPVATAALWWEMHVRLARDAGARLDASLYQEERYEELVAKPVEASKAICRFLDLGYSDRMVRFHEGRTKVDPALGSNKQWLPPTPGLRDWRTQMPPQDVQAFEAVAGDLLQELGYQRSFPTLESRVIERGAVVRAAFTGDLLARGWRLPERWAA